MDTVTRRPSAAVCSFSKWHVRNYCKQQPKLLRCTVTSHTSAAKCSFWASRASLIGKTPYFRTVATLALFGGCAFRPDRTKTLKISKKSAPRTPLQPNAHCGPQRNFDRKNTVLWDVEKHCKYRGKLQMDTVTRRPSAAVCSFSKRHVLNYCKQQPKLLMDTVTSHPSAAKCSFQASRVSLIDKIQYFRTVATLALFGGCAFRHDRTKTLKI